MAFSVAPLSSSSSCLCCRLPRSAASPSSPSPPPPPPPPPPGLLSSSRRLPLLLGRRRRACVELRCTPSSAVSDLGDAAAADAAVPAAAAAAAPTAEQGFRSRFGADEPRKGCDVLVEALERAGVEAVFAYPGGASMEIHQALTRTDRIRNILCRHEQGEIFAAEGYAKSSGRVGVCIATSGPGATNLVTGLADAMLDSVPLVAITGQVPRAMIGTDAFQETPIVEITRPITKHNYLVMRPEDIPRVIQEAFILAQSGRPGPVLVDIPKDVQQTIFVPEWDQKPCLDAYRQRLPPTKVDKHSLLAIMRAIQTARRPIIYCGGGCIDAQKELREFVDITGIPVTSTLMGLGVFPAEDERCLQMLGMHGTVYANYAIDKSDLLLAFGVRFDDRVTGKLEAFAQHARIVHIDIDPAEIGKNKLVDVEVHGDVKMALRNLNTMLKRQDYPLDYSQWMSELEQVRESCPMTYSDPVANGISAQRAIESLCKITKGNAIISTGVGQHQMWSAQWYKFPEPRRWVTSGGLGSMGFGLPSAIGAQAANPDAVVVDIDGDGSFAMNIQELATLFTESLPVKVMVLNNQHLGMVVQWEDRFYKANRAHTYLGDPSKSHERVFAEEDIYPDFVGIARGFNVPAARVSRLEQLEEAIHTMLDTPGPYLLDVIVPFQDHVLPMIPGGGSFKDIITTGSGDDFQ